MVGLTRRRFLGAAGVLAGALLAACGRDEASRPRPSDAQILRGLLQHELRAQEIVALQGAPGRPLAAKQQALFAYVEALPELSDPELRVLVMTIAASEAEHLAALRLEAGGEPVPDAFAGYTAAAP